MTTLTYEKLDTELLMVLPELRERYKEESRWWKGEHPGQHIIFGDLLNPFLIVLLERGGDHALLKRAFAFLEKMAKSQDIRVVNVVAVTVCERLGDNPTWLAKARNYMGPCTTRLSIEVEKGLGREPLERESENKQGS